VVAALERPEVAVVVVAEDLVAEAEEEVLVEAIVEAEVVSVAALEEDLADLEVEAVVTFVEAEVLEVEIDVKFFYFRIN
jgi:hypothetical protein